MDDDDAGDARGGLTGDDARESQADFVGKQFDKETVGKMVLEQYDEVEQRLFYTIVMGGGGDDIHFGIYRDAKDGGARVERGDDGVDDDAVGHGATDRGGG